MAVAYGEGLPPHGTATETRTISDLEGKIRDLIVLRTDADLHMRYDLAVQDFELDWTYHLPPDAAKALEEYHESKRELAEAQDRYSKRAQKAASALTTSARASVRDAGWLMGISYQRVAHCWLSYAELREPEASGRLVGVARVPPESGGFT